MFICCFTFLLQVMWFSNKWSTTWFLLHIPLCATGSMTPICYRTRYHLYKVKTKRERRPVWPQLVCTYVERHVCAHIFVIVPVCLQSFSHWEYFTCSYATSAVWVPNPPNTHIHTHTHTHCYTWPQCQILAAPGPKLWLPKEWGNICGPIGNIHPSRCLVWLILCKNPTCKNALHVSCGYFMRGYVQD